MRSGWMLLLLGLAGCEPMSDPGGVGAVLTPVAVKAATPAPVASTTATPTPAPDPFFEPETIHVPASNTTSAPPETSPTTSPASATGSETGPTTAVVDNSSGTEAGGASMAGIEVVEVQTTPKASVTMSPPISSSMGGSGWPLRLIKTLPDTQPPRAILGLPSGEEIVITPGKMLPEYGLVVMSVGPRSAELAYISPSGDHAAVRSISLSTQY